VQDACPLLPSVYAANKAWFLNSTAFNTAYTTNTYAFNPAIANVNPNWVLAPQVSANSINQTRRNNPSSFIGPIQTTGIEFESFITGNANQQGFYGLVFGATDSTHFYVAQWKFAGANDVNPDVNGLYGTPLGSFSADSGQFYYYSIAGLTLKQYNGSSVSNFSLWTTNATVTDPITRFITGNIDFSNEFNLLYRDPARVSWNVGSKYKFHVSYRPSTGYIRVYAKNLANTIIADTGDIWNAGSITATASRFGLYSFYQSTTFTDPTFKCCDGYIAPSGDCLPYTPCAPGTSQTVAPTAVSDRTCA